MLNKICFIFSIKLCLCNKVNLGFVKDSFCCNEISDKLIIKQTYIIPRFISDSIHFFNGTICFLCSSSFLTLHTFHLHWRIQVFPATLLCQSPIKRDKMPLFSFILPNWTAQFTNRKNGALNAWCGVHLVVNSPVPAATMFICCWMSSALWI